MSQERSKVNPTLFPQFLGSEVWMNLWGVGSQIHRRNDKSTTLFTFDRIENWDSSDRTEFNLARTNSDPDFTLYAFGFNHSQYLDTRNVQQIRGSLRYVHTDERLHPAKMTSFGGMYTVRGYDEYEFQGDKGIMGSVQYEFDLIANSATTAGPAKTQNTECDWDVRKCAPLVFFDYGRATVIDPLPLEKRHEEMISWGFGAILELGDNFVGTVYYGYPLTHTDDTRTGKGRLNAGFMLRH